MRNIILAIIFFLLVMAMMGWYEREDPSMHAIDYINEWKGDQRD